MNNLCSLVSAKVPRMIYMNEEAMEHHCLFPLFLLLGLLLRIFFNGINENNLSKNKARIAAKHSR